MYEPKFLGPQVSTDVIAIKCELTGHACPECKRDLVVSSSWDALSWQDRADIKHTLARVGSRGLCDRCYHTIRRNDPDRLADFERRNVPLEIFAEEYKTLSAARVTKHEIRQTLGMKYRTFEKALDRAKKAGLL